jgi:hypothetical protein
MSSRSIVLGTLGFLLFAATPAHAQRNLAGELVLEDSIAVEIIDRDILAFDLEGSGRLLERLELGEEVLFTGSRGRVAVVLTDRRMLGATPRSGSWRAERYRLSELPQEAAWISQSLALVITGERALAFFGTGHWVEQSIGPREAIVTTRIGPAAGVVVTDRRALGISSDTGGFFETKLRLNEDIESVKALASIVTITTSQRILLFKGPSGTWIEHKRKLR